MKIDLLIAEDDICLNDLVASSLTDEYLVSQAYNLEQAKALCDKSQFSVIVLDYHFPDGDGVELIHHVKKQGNSPIIVFLSASEELDTKMNAFNAGAADWIDKRSFIPPLLLIKIKKALANRQEFDALKEAEQQANTAVFSAMSDSFMWGNTARAIQGCLSCTNYNEFLVHIFSYLQSLELTASVAYSENSQISYWDSPYARACGMEEDLFKLVMQKDERIINAGRRYFFKDSYICILIKNMPEDEVRKGQILDVVAAYIECANHQVNILNQEYVKQLYLKKIAFELDDLQQKMGLFTEQTQQIQSHQSLKFFEIFSQLELTNDEESKLTEVTDDTLMKFEELAYSHVNIINSLNNVIKDFKRQLS